MAQKVEVLCPNGHRVPVNITPNTKVLQILEEACKKQGLEPASDYDLKHGRKALDVTLSVRYAGIPNLAKLELVKATQSRAEFRVIIALQVMSGERIQNAFDPATTLWQMLHEFENDPNCPCDGKLTRGTERDSHPICIYMREEVIGQFALEHTTLKSLGLTGGKALIRLQHRPVSQENLDEIRVKIDGEKARQDFIAKKAAEKLEEDAMKLSKLESDRRINIEETAKANTHPQPQSQSPSPSSQRQEEAMDVNTRNLRPTAAAFVILPGTSVDGSELTPQQEAIAQSLANAINPRLLANNKVSEERARLREERIREQEEKAAAMRAHQAAQQQSEFVNFKFPEATKGKDLYQNEFSDVNKEEYKPCDRETVIYKIEEAKTDDDAGSVERMESDDIPDEFFELNETDVRLLWEDTQRQLKELESQQLMTKAMRLAAKEAKMAKYERVVIRFVFPEKVTIQGLFRPRETVHAIYKFVKEYLEDKTQNFYLYTTPPKCVLKDKSATLIEADLAPMSVVYFGSETKRESYISSGVKHELSNERKAFDILVKYMPKSSHPDSKPSTSNINKTLAASTSQSSDTSKSSKVPKWFKIGK